MCRSDETFNRTSRPEAAQSGKSALDCGESPDWQRHPAQAKLVAFAKGPLGGGVQEGRGRHETASMTRCYTKTKDKGEVARAVGEVLLKARSAHQAA